MTVADYALAVLGAFLTLAAAGLAFMVSLSSSFAPVPDAATARSSRWGCGWFAVLIVLLAWFIGVLWTGRWGWVV